MNSEQCISNFTKKMKDIQETLLDYLEEDDINEEKLFSFLEKQKIETNKYELNDFLHMISKISKNHHRSTDFFTKIEKILKFYQKYIGYYINYDLFNIFKGSKRLLVFLFEQKIIHMEDLIQSVMQKQKYNERDYGKYFCIELQNDYYTQLNDEEIEIHKEKRKIRENDCYICELIRNDSVEDFVSYVTRNNINLNSYIPKSIYETNQFLMNKKTTLVEYSAFFGSIQIFQYLLMNNVDLNSTLWGYSIHGQNPEIIHLLEENNVLNQPSDSHYRYRESCDYLYEYQESCEYLYEYQESIKCHHIDLMNYFKDNFYQSKSNNVIISSLRYFNFINIYNYLNEIDAYGYIKYLLIFDQISLFRYSSKSYYGINMVLHSFKGLKIGYFLKKQACLIHTAVEKKRKEILKNLLSLQQLDPNYEMQEEYEMYPKTLSIKKKTALIIAIENEDTNIVKILLSSSKIDVNFRSTEIDHVSSIKISKTPLFIAVEKENVEIIKCLLTIEYLCINSKSIIKKTKNKIIEQTALEKALEKENIEICKLLLSHQNIDVNSILIEKENINGKLMASKTILLICLEKGFKELAKQILLHPNINPNIRLKDVYKDKKIEKSLLHIFIEEENIEMIKILLTKQNIDVNSNLIHSNKYCTTIKSCLYLAVEKGNIEIVKLLLTNDDIDVNSQSNESTNRFGKLIDLNKISIFQNAVEKDNIEIMKLLLSKNEINVNLLSIESKYENNVLIKMNQNNLTNSC